MITFMRRVTYVAIFFIIVIAMKKPLRGRPFLKSVVVGIVATTVLIGGLAGCSRPSFENVMPLPKTEKALSADETAPEASMGEVTQDSSNNDPNIPEQAIIVNGDATVITQEPSVAASDFVSLVNDQGGKIDFTRQSDTELDHSSVIGARIPTEKYDETIAQLSSFGKVEQQWTDTTDVGQQYVDLNARVKALEDSLVRLNKIAAEATSTDELLQAEGMLTQRQAELDSLKQQLVWLEDQVAMSTLTVTFTTATTDPGSGFSFLRAWDLLLGSLSFLVYALIALSPWLVLGLATLAIVRVTLRRRQARKQQTAATELTSSFADSDDPPAEGDAQETREHE